MKCAGAIFLPECASKRRLLWLFLLADAASDDERIMVLAREHGDQRKRHP